MSYHDPRMPQRGRGLLHWLGLSPTADAAEDAPPSPEGSQALMHDPLRAAREQLLGDINEFLIGHGLDVNGLTLTLAHDYLTGADGLLCRMIDARIQERQPITVEWLEQACHEARGADESEELAALMARLEGNLEEFGRTTGAAKTAASDYSAALAVHVDELGGTRDSGLVVAELAALARAMLDRTRELEKDMNRSALQSQVLRRSLDDARKAAEEDQLTGLPNRRSFEARYMKEFAEAQAAGEHLCIAFCDIDFFKQVNDTHGHEAGDRVLRSVAGNLGRIADARCHVARHGGEEFVILLRGRTLQEAWEVLDDARSRQAERRLVNRANDVPFGKITFSGGVANVFAYPDPRAALRAADSALYQAKSEGRNRIAVADGKYDEVNTRAA